MEEGIKFVMSLF